jgi:hypothetical protein
MIKNLFKKLCCCHEWEQVRRINVYKDDNEENLPVRFILLYCCKKCGKFKKIEI